MFAFLILDTLVLYNKLNVNGVHFQNVTFIIIWKNRIVSFNQNYTKTNIQPCQGTRQYIQIKCQPTLISKGQPNQVNF